MNIAVIIVGIYKFDEKSLNEIIRCYDLKEKNVDIFIYNNNSLHQNNIIVNHFNNNNINVVSIKSCYYTNSDINVKEFKINKNIENIWLDFKNICFKENIINKNTSPYVTLGDSNFFYPNIIGHEQYKQIYLGLLEIEKYEKNIILSMILL